MCENTSDDTLCSINVPDLVAKNQNKRDALSIAAESAAGLIYLIKIQRLKNEPLLEHGTRFAAQL